MDAFEAFLFGNDGLLLSESFLFLLATSLFLATSDILFETSGSLSLSLLFSCAPLSFFLSLTIQQSLANQLAFKSLIEVTSKYL